MKKIFFILICLLLFGSSVQSYAQKNKAFRAYAAFEAGAFSDAIDLFKEAYDLVNDKTQKTDILFHIGECYRRISLPLKAALWYKKAVEKDYSDPIIYLRYGEMLLMNEKFDLAKDQFVKYKSLVADDPRGETGIQSCANIQEMMDNPSGYQVENMKYFNTKWDDFSPCYAKSDYMTVYFTSSRSESKGAEMHGATGQEFTDIFSSTMDKKGKWSVPVPLDENINTEMEEGTPVLSADYNTLYFSRCKMSKNKNFGCQIYYAKRNGETWSKAQPIEIAGDSITIAHPAISPDELTLYFVSDMPGGVGGKDIWMVTRTAKGGEWSPPKNLGPPINTKDDEMFPYVHADGTLYFSSNGHVGMGGLDIYLAKKNEDGTWKVENMRPPINSSADDYGICFQKDEERGFFSSNRSAKGDDNIYSFVLPPLKFNVIGTVKDEKTEQLLPEVTVKSIGSDGMQIETKTTKDGSFKFMLKPNTDYVFIAAKDGYLNGKERETTKGMSKSKDIHTNIYLSSIAKPIDLPNIFYDFNKADLRPESMVTLDKFIETLNDNPNVTIELMSHTDARGGVEPNIELSQRRAQSVVDYLIQKGIASDRLSAKGYGKSQPKVADKKISDLYSFLPVGTTLGEDFINALKTSEQQEIAHQINRRTEFKVLRTDYIPKK
jgi:peptidoglycan-associated lipoprotein